LYPLLSEGKDGVAQVSVFFRTICPLPFFVSTHCVFTQTVELLDHYSLSKEDFSESLKEMQFIAENDKVLKGQEGF
jgi:hypothetical protein